MEVTAEKQSAARVSKTPAAKENYFEAVGRRKESIARVRLFTKRSTIEINEKPLATYFPVVRLQKKVVGPIEKMKLDDKLGAVVKVRGGGLTGQADAIALGLARALTKFNPEFRKRLRRLGFLTRDARVVERKKYGLKKARRAPQWQKR